jgi:hypothetical protein
MAAMIYNNGFSANDLQDIQSGLTLVYAIKSADSNLRVCLALNEFLRSKPNWQPFKFIII